MSGASILIKNGRPMGKMAADVLVTDGVIAAIGPNLTAPAGTPVEDAAGALVLSPNGRFTITHVTPRMAAGWWDGRNRPTVQDRFR